MKSFHFYTFIGVIIAPICIYILVIAMMVLLKKASLSPQVEDILGKVLMIIIAFPGMLIIMPICHYTAPMNSLIISTLEMLVASCISGYFWGAVYYFVKKRKFKR